MPDEVKPDVKQAPTHDAQLAAENMTTGEEKAPMVDVEGDYEASKQFSVSDVDRTAQGAEAAQAATAPKFNVSKPEETNTEAKPTGNPDDYREMAKDITSETQTVEDTEDLVKKALEKGKPGQ